MSLLVAGIHTGIGKTVCSAVLAEALHFDYWKPVHAGDLHASDSIFVKDQISNSKTIVHEEAYRFRLAASPHWAARQEGREITLAAEDVEELRPARGSLMPDGQLADLSAQEAADLIAYLASRR